jgi:hypothetical protein
VRGSLTAYRIHLGSGAIHIELGNYLCIVPDGFAARASASISRSPPMRTRR